jgi:hypothetical protein
MADEVYCAGVKWLLGQTRDKKRIGPAPPLDQNNSTCNCFDTGGS